ncbi:MAG: hypothetical protein CMJ45_09095 [Planctomyces sp.]|nr:hypothetical protein [Planctomyces sp.]
MKIRHKLIREGQYAAEVDVDLIYDESEWAPYLSLEEAERLDEVREALRKGDVRGVSHFGRIFKLMPITI